MVKDQSDSERGNPLPPHGLLFPTNRTARVLLYAPSHRQYSTYHGLCYISRGALAGTRNSSMGTPIRLRTVGLVYSFLDVRARCSSADGAMGRRIDPS